MHDNRRAVMASTFRAWWQSLADQDPDEIAAGNTHDARRLWSALVEIGQRNGAVITEGEGNPATSSWAYLDPDSDSNDNYAVCLPAALAKTDRAPAASD